MFCPNCGNKISDDANFCDSCGRAPEKGEKLTKEVTGEDKKMDLANQLWKKFLEIARAEDDKAKEYRNLSSDAIWELLARFSHNSFNELIEKHKIDLDGQPYRVVEAIKSYLTSFALNSYQVFITEKLLKKDKFGKANIKDPEILAEEWKRVFLNHSNKIITIPEDVTVVLDAINGQIADGLFNNNPTLKELPKAVVDSIKDKLIQQLIYGYLLGVAEDNLRTKGRP